MKWNQKIFLKNIELLVKNKCNGMQKKFNDIIGDRDAVTRYKQGYRPSLMTLLKISEKFNCSLDWLVTGRGIVDLDTINIPLYKVEASAGLTGIETGDYPEVLDELPFKIKWLESKGYKGKRINDLCLIRAKGDSMEPTIYDGEVVLIDTSLNVRTPDTIKNGKVYVIRWGWFNDHTSGISIKRIHLDWEMRKVIAVSDNRDLYKPIEITIGKNETLQDLILARVIWVGKENI